jgi:hypothetical protein
VQQAELSITRVGTAAIQVSWRTNYGDQVLEYAHSFPAATWSTVTNAVTTNANRLAVTVQTDASQQFYRLRQPLVLTKPPAPTPPDIRVRVRRTK